MGLDILHKYLNEHQLQAILINKPENRRYFSGFTGSSGVLLCTLNHNELITDFRYIEQAALQAKKFEIVRHGSSPFDTIVERLKAFHVKNIGYESDFVTCDWFITLNKLMPDIKYVPVHIDSLRMVKNKYEISLIQKAVDIADEAFTHILKFIKPGVTEQAVALELEYKMRQLGAEKTSFDTIVASGVRSALPHGRATDKVIEYGDLVTMDFGAVYNGYCSDMTRTIIVGKADVKQREIYNIVLEAQLAGVKAVKADLTGQTVDSVARKIIEDAGYAKYFGHGLGHGVGLAIHEEPRLSITGDITLKENMVVTVEPGIYIPGWGGVRIEDMVVVSASGGKILTASSKALIELDVL